jgi:hypothetical protein
MVSAFMRNLHAGNGSANLPGDFLYELESRLAVPVFDSAKLALSR